MLLKKQGKYRFEDFEIDLARRSLLRDGRSVTIGARSFDLLAILIQNGRRPVSKEELMHAVWPGADVEESNLNQHMFLLRKALTGTRPDAPSGEKILASVPGRGYQFTAPITEVESTDIEEGIDPGKRRFMTAIEPPAQAKETDRGKSSKPVEPSAPDWLEEDESDGEPDVPEAPPFLRHSRMSSRIENSGGEISHEEDEAEAPRSSSPFRLRAGFRRPGLWLWIVVGTLVLAAIAGTVFLLRPKHEELPGALSLMIADFENSTGNPDLDGAIKTALSLDLRQSPYLTVESESKAADESATGKAATGFNADRARKICSQLHDHGYITGSLRHIASKYIVSIQTHSCSDGRKLSGTVGIADSPDAVISVLDRVAVDLRKQLGEPVDSVTRFSKPFFAQRNPSLEGLKAYSEGSRAQKQGKIQDSIALLQRAVELDPQFALAFAELGTAYSALGQKTLADAAMNSAYQLRETVGELNRLSIEADYHRLVTGDLLASIRTDKLWREEYPRDPIPLNDLGEIEVNIGRPALALEAAQRSLELSPTNGDAYLVLARAQLHLGQIEEAATTCRKAIAQHVDSAELHGFLYQIGFLRLDQPAMDEQMAWAKGRGDESPEESYMLTQQGLMDFAQGKVKAGVAVFTHLAESYRGQAQEDRADRLSGELPRIEAELGYVEPALSLLLRLPDIHGSADVPIAWAETDETSRAEKLLQRELDTYPTATLWQEDLGPQIRGAIALNHHEPEKAITALTKAQDFDLRSFDVPAMTGRAYLMAKAPALAETSFRKIIDHPGIEPLSYNYPMAQLGLARSLAQQGKLVDASQVYKVVLAIWRDADPDLPRLRDAKAEYAKLGGTVASSASLVPKPVTKPVAKTSPTANHPPKNPTAIKH